MDGEESQCGAASTFFTTNQTLHSRVEHNMGVRGDECALTCRIRIFGQLTGLGTSSRTDWLLNS